MSILSFIDCVKQIAQGLQFGQYGAIFRLSAYFWLYERIVRCADPAVYTEYRLCASIYVGAALLAHCR